MFWFSELPMDIQIMISALIGVIVGALFCFFGEILSPDDIV